MSNTLCVLDASAVLAYFHGEPGHDKVEANLNSCECQISAVNVAEVLTKLLDHGLKLDDAHQSMQDLGIAIVPFDEAEAYQAAKLRPPTKIIGASLGDRACMALALRLKAKVATAERSWSTVKIPGLHVELTR